MVTSIPEAYTSGEKLFKYKKGESPLTNINIKETKPK